MDVTGDQAPPAGTTRERDPHRARRLAGRILRGAALLVAGVIAGTFLLGGISAWNARRELHAVQGQLSSLRVQELRDRVTPLLTDDEQRARAKKVFEHLDDAALEGRVHLDDTYELRKNLDESLDDLTLSGEEAAAFLDLADSVAD